VAYAALVLIYTTDACAGTQKCLHTVPELHLDLSSLQSLVLHLDGIPLQPPKLNLVLSGQQLPACAACVYTTDSCDAPGCVSSTGALAAPECGHNTESYAAPSHVYFQGACAAHGCVYTSGAEFLL
jgi:hypothetical protein